MSDETYFIQFVVTQWTVCAFRADFETKYQEIFAAYETELREWKKLVKRKVSWVDDIVDLSNCSSTVRPHPTPHHTTPHHATQRHATPRHATPRHATPRHATQHHATSHTTTPHHTTPHHATPRHITPHHATPHHHTTPHATPHTTHQQHEEKESLQGSGIVC